MSVSQIPGPLRELHEFQHSVALLESVNVVSLSSFAAVVIGLSRMCVHVGGNVCGQLFWSRHMYVSADQLVPSCKAMKNRVVEDHPFRCYSAQNE